MSQECCYVKNVGIASWELDDCFGQNALDAEVLEYRRIFDGIINSTSLFLPKKKQKIKHLSLLM